MPSFSSAQSSNADKSCPPTTAGHHTEAIKAFAATKEVSPAMTSMSLAFYEGYGDQSFSNAAMEAKLAAETGTHARTTEDAAMTEERVSSPFSLSGNTHSNCGMSARDLLDPAVA